VAVSRTIRGAIPLDHVHAAGGLAAGGAVVWLYLRDDRRTGRTPSDTNVRIVPAAGLAVLGRF
jgi:hypothetical protein